MINCGIDSDNYEKTLNLIMNEINIKNIDKTEVDSARKELISSVETLLDSPSNIINYYYGMEVFKADKIDLKIKNYNRVTIKDIESLSNKIKPAAIYFLKGIDYEEE